MSTKDSANSSGMTATFDYPYKHMDRGWPDHPGLSKLRGIFEIKLEAFRGTLKLLSGLEDHFADIPVYADISGTTPFWNNIWLPALDAISVAGLVALRRPEVYVEVGSGNSTKFVRWIIDKLGLPTRVVSIDPFPRAEIDSLCDVIIRTPLEHADQKIFHDLNPNDVVFIDNSHRSFPSSDVTVFFIEILPSLPKGVIFGLHDIFLPFDYPLEWNDRFYNEQYLMAAWLQGGGDGSEIIFSTHFMWRLYQQECRDAFPRLVANKVAPSGGALFIQR